MKKVPVLFGVFALLLGFCGVAGAVTINFNYAVNGNEYTSPYAGVTVETFNSLPLTGWGGAGGVVLGTTGNNSAPFGVYERDSSNYMSVPRVGTSGYTETFSLPHASNYLGLWWGSIDTYNKISFYDGNVLVKSYTGAEIYAAANGNQTSHNTNFYVNFLDLPNFNKVEFYSSSYAFEFDNVAYGAVPEPGTMLLLGSGLLALVGFRKKFRG